MNKLRYKRTVLNFEIGENVKCFLSSVKKISGKRYSGEPWQGIMISHGAKYQDPTKGERYKYFRDRYFINEVKEHEWKLAYFISKLGGKPYTNYKGNLDIDNYINGTIKVIESLKGKEYYLKTRLRNSKDNLYLSRGFHPYISLQPDLEYKEKEDQFHKFIITKGL